MRAGLLILCVLLTVSLQAQTDLLYQFEKQVIAPEMRHAAAREEVFNSAPTGNYDLRYQRCEWYLNPDTLFVSGKITSYFIITENTTSIYFDCSDSLEVDAVLYHGSEMAFTLLANELSIALPGSLTAGLLDSISVIYHGNPVSSGFGSFEITEHETANTIWTLSEPYGASDWWPCKQTLDDKIDSLDVFVTTPIGFSSGGPGLLLDSLSDGVNTTFHWKTNYPIANYLIGVAVSNYKAFELYAPNNGDSVLLYNMVYPENFDEAVAGVTAIVPSFELYADKFGDYPFATEKYGQLQFGWGGGMEHQTMSSVTSFGYDLLNHEMAHQWFGDKITCASWRDIWLNEGFATFCSWICYDFSEDPFHYYEAWLKGTRDVIVSKANGSVWCDDTTSVGRIFDGRLTYYKGAWLLNMLRQQLGDDAFFTGVKNYITDPQLIYGFAHTDDLIAHLESAADTSLTEFFNDWFYGQGFPSYQILWNCNDQNHITIALSQTTSDPSVDFFEMKVPLRLKGENDSLDIIIPHYKNGQLYELDVPFFVNDIDLDPDYKILHANDAVTWTALPKDVLQLVVFPNPIDEELHIQLFAPDRDQYIFTLYNGGGQQVINESLLLDGTAASVVLDVASFGPGIYCLIVKGSEKEIVQKVIIQ